MTSDPLEIIADLRQKGFTDEQIVSLLQPGQGGAAVEPAVDNNHIAPAPAPKPTHRLNAVQIVVGIGVSLVLLAVLVVIANQWSSFTPLGKTLLVLIPNAALYLISFLTSRYPEQAENTLSLKLVAALLVPLSVGTVIYQFGVYPTVDHYLIGWCALLGWSLFYSLEWRTAHPQLSALTLLFLFTTVASFWPQDLTVDQNLWLLTLGGGALALAGWAYHFRRPDMASIRYLVGLLVAVIFFTAAISYNLSELDVSRELHAGLFILLGAVYSLLGRAFPHTLEGNPWQQAQTSLRTTFTEGGLVLATVAYAFLMSISTGYQYGALFLGLIFSLCSLFIPLATPVPLGSLLLLTGSLMLLSSAPYLSTYLLLFILGLLLCLLTIRIKIDTFLPVGGLLLVVSALVASNTLFADTLGWPITIFILGLFLIFVGIGLRRLWQKQAEDLTAYHPLVPWRPTATPAASFKNTAASKRSCWHYLGWLILLYLGLQLLLSLLVAAFFTRY